MILIVRKLLLIFLFFSYVTAIASDTHDSHNLESEFDEHSAHEHGHAKAQITFINNILRLDLSLPSIDIFGFEHDPRNEEEHEVVLESQSTLNNAEKIVTLLPTKLCELTSTNFESRIFDSINEEHTDHNQHKSDGHHEDETHDKHHEEEHSDVSVQYEYICLSEDLQSIEFKAFEYFTTIEEIEVQYISNENQKLFTATPSNSSLSLK